jgi:hypothetical protein
MVLAPLLSFDTSVMAMKEVEIIPDSRNSQVDESRVEVELIDLVKFPPEALG